MEEMGRQAAAVQLYGTVGRHRDILESVVMETGRETLHPAIAAQVEDVALQRVVTHGMRVEIDVVHLDRTVVTQQLAMLHLNTRTLFAAYA